MKSLAACFTVVIISLVFSMSLKAQNLTAEEIIAKHLDSIGTAAKRSELKSVFAAGVSGFEANMPTARGKGKMVVVSDPNNLYFLMSLNLREYPFEKIGMFGDKISLPYTTAGNRSLLSAFLAQHPHVLTDNLLCGSMSMRWISRISDAKRLKLRYAGTKKIDGVETYVVDAYGAVSGTSDFTIKLYFDAQNFRHVRTEYHREVQVGKITFGRQNQSANSRLDLVEEFSDFKEADGLTFPYSYKITFVSNEGKETLETSWSMKVSGYYLNQNLAPDFFTFDIKDK